uniref:Uncharacterized protein n=1 Tax=Pygocentrus nattereri TaxID=42514 RepID=A0A3B4C5H5_PYGNA
DHHHHAGELDLVRLGEALDGLEHHGEAERGEEDGVDERAHHLRADPAERVLVGGGGARGEAHGHERHHQRDHVGEHVEGVREHRERRRPAAHHHLHHEEAESQRQHPARSLQPSAPSLNTSTSPAVPEEQPDPLSRIRCCY